MVYIVIGYNNWRFVIIFRGGGFESIVEFEWVWIFVEILIVDYL